MCTKKCHGTGTVTAVVLIQNETLLRNKNVHPVLTMTTQIGSKIYKENLEKPHKAPTPTLFQFWMLEIRQVRKIKINKY